ncbi:MAG: GntR family transcriptional regulator [Chloroflexi bacterium]|nr:GntR family transcriptional regulator [Chloroflexota bacterium]
MNIEINFQTHVPIYIQIMDQIKHKIAANEIAPGDQLPTVRQMAADLRVNFNTIARAYRLMDEDGIISTQHGRGTFILDQPTGKEAEKLRRQDLERLTHHYLIEAHKLGHSPEEVKDIFLETLDLWEKNGAPSLPDDKK